MSRTVTLPARLVVALSLAAYAGLVWGYLTLTPLWQNPDEPAHYNYVAFVAQTGGLPELRPGDWDSGLLERLKNGRLEPGDSIGGIRYESWQPPLFYLAASPLLRFTGDETVEVLAYRLRGFDAVLGALTLVVAFLVAREVLPPRLAMAVPPAIAGVPMFTAISAGISADPLANLLAAVVLLVLVRRACGRAAGPRWALGAGALIGLGILAKLPLAIFVPLSLLVILLSASSRRRRDCLVLLATTSVVMLPWLVHQVTTYGWTDPLATTRHAQVVLDQPRFPGLSPEYLAAFLTVSFHSFWAQFGWMAVVASDRLYWIWGVLVLFALAGVWLFQRQRVAEPGWQILLLTIAAALVGYVGYNLAYQQFQGRYLFTALVPIVIVLVSGWAAWLPRWAQGWGALLVATVLVALNGFALLRVLVPGFAPIS